MKFKISGSAASSLGMLAMALRILFGVTIELPGLYNAGWIAVLLGGILALPLAFAATWLRNASSLSPIGALSKRSPAWVRVLTASLSLTAVYDAAVVSDIISCSASYVALNSVNMIYLMLPQLLLCYFALSFNGDAIGFSAGIWNRILPWIVVIIIFVEFRQFRLPWLTPILGPGAAPLLDGALRVAGWLSLLTGLLMISEKDTREGKPLRPVWLMVRCCLIAAVLVLLHNLMTPALVEAEASSRFFLLDTLLTNGRSPLSLQLPMMILWFIGLFLLLLFDAFTSVALLQATVPRLTKLPCILIVLGAIVAMSLGNLTANDIVLAVQKWLYVIHGILLGIAMIQLKPQKGSVSHA